MRLIDADALKMTTIGAVDAQGNFYGSGDVVMAEDVASAPTIDPVKHGRWKQVQGSLRVKCSACASGDESQPINFSFYAYCPQCGAKMDLGGVSHGRLQNQPDKTRKRGNRHDTEAVGRGRGAESQNNPKAGKPGTGYTVDGSTELVGDS